MEEIGHSSRLDFAEIETRPLRAELLQGARFWNEVICLGMPVDARRRYFHVRVIVRAVPLAKGRETPAGRSVKRHDKTKTPTLLGRKDENPVDTAVTIEVSACDEQTRIAAMLAEGTSVLLWRVR